MKKLFYAVIFSFIGITCYAQQELYTENRTVGEFNRISASGGIEVSIEEGQSTSIKVETNNSNMLDKLKTDFKNGELKISLGTLNSNNIKNQKIKVYVSANSLTGIHVSSVSQVYTTGKLTADDIKISARSGSNINLNIQAVRIECDATAGSNIKLKGSSDFIKAESSGGAGIDAKELNAEKAEGQASSGAYVKLNVSEEISGKASGGGSVTYTGSARLLNKKQSSGGSVRKG